VDIAQIPRRRFYHGNPTLHCFAADRNMAGVLVHQERRQGLLSFFAVHIGSELITISDKLQDHSPIADRNSVGSESRYLDVVATKSLLSIDSKL
jgi:hypothetical protein